MTRTRIVDIGVEIPEPTVSIADVADKLALTPTQLRMHTWFLGQRNIAISPANLHEMLLRPAERLLAARDPERISHILYAHTVPHVAPPSAGFMETLRRQLGATRARAIALSQQSCTTPIYALKLAGTLLARELPDRWILLLAGERSFPAASRVIPGTTIMGEATVAVLLGAGAQAGDQLLAVSHRILGQYHEAAGLPDEMRSRYDAEYAQRLASIIDQTVAEAGVRHRDVTAVMPHNVNRYSWRAVMAHSAIEFSRVYLDNMAHIGHCFGADPFINLATAKRSGAVGQGDAVVLATAGLGATFGAAVVRIGVGE